MSEKIDFSRIFEGNNCLVKGDISGIQDYIFNVKSQGAAKVLRARSFYVYALAETALQLFREKLGEDKVLLLFNGGGNFYFFSRDLSDVTFESIKGDIDSALNWDDLQLVLTKQDYNPKELTFQQVWKRANLASAKAKLRKFWAAPEVFSNRVSFVPCDKAEDLTENYRAFASSLGKVVDFEWVEESGVKKVTKDQFNLLGKGFKLKKGTTGRLENHIIAQAPIFRKDLEPEYRQIIEAYNKEVEAQNRLLPDGKREDFLVQEEQVLPFEIMGAFAKYRTGTDKLGILKLDVDSLGNTLSMMSEATKLQQFSSQLDGFFTQELTKIWRGTFTTLLEKGKVGTARFDDNISVIFAGGDDCMAVGAWDAIFEFAKAIHDKFDKAIKGVTFSAALLMVDSKFPVVRFAEMADDALDKAKEKTKEKQNPAGTSYVHFLKQSLTWSEFDKCRTIAHQVQRLIMEKDEPRSILDRIARSAVGYTKIAEKAKKGTLHNAKVWRLFYYIRNTKNKEEIMDDIIHEYEKALMDFVIRSNQPYTNPQVFPLAARWAEFLTRKKQNNER